MWVVRALVEFNADCHDMEKYKLKWLRVLDCVRGLGFESYVCQLYVILMCIILNIVFEHE